MMSHPLEIGFLGSFCRINSGMPNVRVFQNAFLELSYDFHSKDIFHTFVLIGFLGCWTKIEALMEILIISYFLLLMDLTRHGICCHQRP